MMTDNPRFAAARHFPPPPAPVCLRPPLHWLTLAIALGVACGRDLAGPGPDVGFEVSITTAIDSAAVGSTELRTTQFQVTASNDGEYEWSIAISSGDWLAVSESTGTTPSDISVSMDPVGLPVGTYDDTVLVTLEVAETGPLAIPVTFRIYPCDEQELTPGTPVSSSLTRSDCGAPGRTASFAEIYAFPGVDGDTVSIVMTSNVFDAYLILDSVPDGESPSLIESDACPDASGNACLLDYELPYTGDYYIEATTAVPDQVGGYTIEISTPTAVAPSFVLFAQGFSSPLLATAPPDDVERVFVVEQTGSIRIVRAGVTLPAPFLDLSGEISSGGERGLLGLAFAPDYSSSGTFFVNHTGADGETRVVRYQVSGDPDVADATSADTLLVVSQPFSNHNGGHLTFGSDDMLYIGLGDGGSGGDPQGHGQNLSTLLGNILRIDVSGASGYEVPPDNPYVNDPPARPEIWISGVRNPWRFSFDRQSGDLYVGDVGQGSWEEITVQSGASDGGENFGWNVMEGAHCYQPSSGCNQSGLTLPVVEYSHSEGCSITGGFVYRGNQLPDLVGHYFYSDYCSGWVRSFRLVGGQVTESVEWDIPFSGNVTSLGEDAEGNLYVVLQDGRIYRMEP